MKIVRACMPIAALLLCVGLSACTPASVPEGGAPSASVSASPSASDPSPSATAPAPSATPRTTVTPEQPVAKVTRPGTGAPTQTAKPAAPTSPVTYPDGVAVKITDVSFGEETSKGPGAFPGREYARLTLELSNASKTPIDLGTSVLTVLDSDGKPVAPVYAYEADVHDFAGTLAPGKTASAVYAFAVPDSSRSKITLVVDFDADHTSAVFRGALS